MDPQLLPRSGTRKIQSWIRIRKKIILDPQHWYFEYGSGSETLLNSSSKGFKPVSQSWCVIQVKMSRCIGSIHPSLSQGFRARAARRRSIWLEPEPVSWIRIGSVFRSFLDPDPDSEYGSGSTHANIG